MKGNTGEPGAGQGDEGGDPGWVTARDAARHLGVPPRQLYDLIDDGALPAYTSTTTSCSAPATSPPTGTATPGRGERSLVTGLPQEPAQHQAAHPLHGERQLQLAGRLGEGHHFVATLPPNPKPRPCSRWSRAGTPPGRPSPALRRIGCPAPTGPHSGIRFLARPGPSSRAGQGRGEAQGEAAPRSGP